MPRREVMLWLAAAREDLEDAEDFLRRGRWFRAAFFAQQAVEKALKALILHKLRKEPPRTHIISEILRELKQAGVVEFSPEDELRIVSLGKFYTVTRYPDAANGLPSESVSRDEALIAVETARKVFEFAARAVEQGDP